MQKIPELNVIIEPKDIANLTSLEQIIKERRLIKTKLKLMHILAIDSDLQKLEENGLGLHDLNINNFYLTETYNLVVPIKNKIINIENNNKIKLKSYLIYLSYLYNYDFLDIYYNNPKYLYHLIFNLNISDDIKQNIFHLLANVATNNFSDYIEELNNVEFRDSIEKDKLKLIKNL